MPIVPSSNHQERLNGSSMPYIHLNANADTFGGSIARAKANMAGAVQEANNTYEKIQDTINETKVMKFNNAVEKWKQETLLDKENGYFIKQGADAAGKTNDIMKSYDEFVKNWKNENKVAGFYGQRIEDIASQKRTGILGNVTNHDIEQTNKYAAYEGKLGIDNAISAAVSERNNLEGIKLQMANIKQISTWQGSLQHLDENGIELLVRENISNAHKAVLESYIQEGSLLAGDYFENFKNEIDPSLHSRFIGAIKNEEMKYETRNLANNIIAASTNEQEALIKAEAIEDINKQEQVISRIKRHYNDEEHFKSLEEKEALDSFYSKAVQTTLNGGSLSYDDIPDNIDPQTKLSLMNYVNKNGQTEDDNETWQYLYDMSVNNAQGFSKIDLNKYRGFLSDSEFKSFYKKQQDIQAGGYYSQIKDDNEMINAALKTLGLDKNSAMFFKGDKKDIAYSEIRSYVREHEARKGRKITDDELSNFINSLGYKESNGVQLYKQLEKGMRERVGFMKDVVNDFAYYQSKHNGELPPDSEKLKIINKRISIKAQEQNQELIDSLDYKINNTTAKPNETKELTYYADKYVPQLGKELGVKFTIVDGGRYRKPNGKYNSYHSKGEAVDVSMSEHTKETKLRFIEAQLQNPQVKAIGTSDPLILAKFKGNPKIVNESNFDKQHGTNHINHAHITLNVKVKMKAPDGKIVYVPSYMVAQAIKNGGVRL